MNEVQTQLLNRLREIVEEYVVDKNVAARLAAHIEPLKIKYVLHELELIKSRPFSSSDKEVIKDIYFNFC